MGLEIKFLLIHTTHKIGVDKVYINKNIRRNGSVVGAVNLDNSDYIMLITNKGKTIKISASDMKTITRNTQVFVCKTCLMMMISAISSERTED